MICERCGNPIPTGQTFCPACGAAVRTSAPKEPVATHPMKWYKFLIYFLLFFSAFANLLSSFSYFSGTVQGAYAAEIYAAYPGMKAVDILSGFCALGFAAWAILTRIALGKYSRFGPMMICVFYLASSAFNLLYRLSATLVTGINLFDVSTIASIVAGLVFAYVNHIYFKKRKAMFVR